MNSFIASYVLIFNVMYDMARQNSELSGGNFLQILPDIYTLWM
jgi:hypothetical protein